MSWEQLQNRLEITYTASGEVLTPSAKDLDAFEKAAGCKLPVSYREFACKFGPGTFGSGWQIDTPGFPKDPGGDLTYRNSSVLGKGRTPEFITFCGKEDYEGWFAWKPEDVTDPATHEYGIYLLLDEPVRIASTFEEFVMEYALGGGFDRQERDEERAAQRKPDDPVVFSQTAK